MTSAIIIAIVTGLLVNEFCDVSPWLARKLARWSALRRYAGTDRAEARAEELAALINERPGNLLKVATALCFAAGAMTSHHGASAGARSGRARTTVGIGIAVFGAGGLADGIAILASHGMPAAEFIGGSCMALCYVSGGVCVALARRACPACPLPFLLACASNVTLWFEHASATRAAFAVGWFASFAFMAAVELTAHRGRKQLAELVAEHDALYPDCTECFATAIRAAR